MKHAIAGLAPPELGEITSMVVWPTIGSNRLGRMVGQLADNRIGFGFFTLGKIFALATIPFTLLAFAWQFRPFACRRYRLSNMRIGIQKGLQPVDDQAIELDDFDAIDIEHLPGQDFFHAGELVFRRGSQEVLRLSGISRPEIFRKICLEAQTAILSVRRVQQEQAAVAEASASV